MSTANKLTYLNTTKQNLKTVINTTGAGLTDESTFRSYANVLNDKILGAINGDVDLFEEYPKVSGNGTDLSLNGVVEGKMAITPQGVSSQDGEPTPTTSIPVKSVTGENSLVISNSDNSETQNYQLSLGNIELNSSPDETIRDGIIGSSDVSYNLLDETTFLPKSTINGTTGEIEGYDGCGASEQYISVLPNTQYTFSCSATMLALRVSCYNLEKEHIERKSSTSNVKSFSFLTPDDCHYVRCSFNYNNVIIVTQEVLNTLNLQVTEGSEAKPYFPYGQVGMWYKREYIGKVVLDGSENYESMIWPGGRFSVKTSINDLRKTTSTESTSYVLSNNYKAYTQIQLFNLSVPNYGISNRATQNEIIIRNDDIATVEDFKQWLSTHNTTVWYQKAQYTDIPITDTALISQLNDIYNNAHSYNGVTNITTTYEDGNEQMYLDIEALKNVWEVTE